MKNYEQFVTDTKSSIKDFLPESFRDAELRIDEVCKNNGVKREALVIEKAEDLGVPILYFDSYYQNYQRNDNFEETLKDMAFTYLRNRNQEELQQTVDKVKDFEKVKDMLSLKVVNREDNQEMLCLLPHKEVDKTDLAVIFQIKTPQIEDYLGTIKVNHEMLSHWDLDVETLYQITMQNSQSKEPFVITDIENIVFHKDVESEENKVPQIDEDRPYILSNKDGMFGAAVMLYPNLLEQIAQQCQSNLYILPSSTHEVLFLRASEKMEPRELQEMVIETNMTQVPPEIWLSNQVYKYDHNEHELSLATSPEQTKELIEQYHNRIQEAALAAELEEEECLDRW